MRAEFPCDSRIEPVFLGREVAVRISVGLRGSVTEGDGGERESAVYRYGESLPLRAEFDGRVCRFLGWSRKGYLRDGGELVSKELAYELELLGDSELYANFEAIRQYPLRFSDDSGDSPLSETMYGRGLRLPAVDDGSFRREGYRCVGFTESKVTVPENLSAKWLLALEAREDFHSFGSMLAMPGRALTLSPVLIPETNPALLRFSESGGSAVVLGFSDAGKTARTDLLVLPERAPDGKTVTAIAENAFEGCGELIKADIPAGVKTIGAGAFRGCVSLRSLSLPETLRTLSGDAFDGCAALSRLCIHPTLEKVFDIDYDSALADKYMRLLTTEGEEKRLLLVGGSGCAYGINSGMLEEAFEGYTVVNLGTAVNYGIRPLLSILEARCKKGDVVLFSPEYREEMYGEPSTAMTSWQFLESNYDILRDIDLRKNGNLLSTYVSYLQSKRRFLSSGTKKYNSIVYSRASFDLRGDLIAHRQTGLKPFESHLPDPGILHEKGLSCLREGLTRLREKGVRCLYSFPLLADPGGLSKAEIRQAEESFLHALLPGVGAEEGNLTVISEMENSIAPVSDFYDSMYHATLSGAKRRTERLIRDLTPYLSDE